VNILHVISDLDPRAGGPPAIAIRMACAQAGLGHAVTILSQQMTPEAATRVDQANERLPNWRDLHRVEVAPFHFPLGVPLLSRHRREAMSSAIAAADVVHLHSVWDPILPVAAGIARKLDKPYVVLLNGMLDPWSLNQKAIKKRVALALRYRSMLQSAAALQLGNANERDLIDPLNLTTRGQIIGNGFTPAEIDPLPERGSFRALHPQLQGKLVVLFLARLHYKKGLDFLADAFARTLRDVPHAMLVVAGPDDGARDDFEQQIARLGIADRVLLTGPLYGEARLAALADADVFVLPSRQEGFSMSVVEALACGLPCVVTDASHFPQVASHGAGEVVGLSAEAIAGGLTRLLASSTLRTRMASNAKAYAYRELTWQSVARQTLKLYADVIAQQQEDPSAA
jgi:glycosyltransferase involved in cell wall biosynthesis